jgi:hypothetical protein
MELTYILRLLNPAFVFGPTTGVLIAFRRRGRNGAHYRLGLSLFLQLTRRNTTPTPHQQYF